MTKKLSILITGGAGYIGSILVPALLEDGHSVTVLDNFMYRQTGLLANCANERFTVVRGDCRDEALIRAHVAQADVVIPLAALVGAPLCAQRPYDAESINRDAVLLLIKHMSRDQRMIYPNTNSGYGIGEKDKYCTEESPLRPISLYGRTKVEAENAVLQRENSATFRFATVFGSSPRMRLDLLVNDFVWRAVTDRAVVIFEGHFKRNYIHIRDAAAVFRHTLENFEAMKGRAYNAGLEDANLSKIELCEKIAQYVPGFIHVEAPIGEDIDKRDYIVSNRRLIETGFATQWNLDMGIQELIRAYAIMRKPFFGNV